MDIDYSKDEPGSVRAVRTLERMRGEGGHFAHYLAEAWMRADGANFARLMQGFGHLYAHYAASVGDGKPPR